MEETLEHTPVYEGNLIKVYRDRVRLPEGREATREVVRHPGSVGIVPKDERGRIVLVRQYRYVPGREMWEIPAGTCDHPDESVEESAARELAEEAGLKAGSWRNLGRAYLVPGYGDELMTFFVAEQLEATEAHADLDESFRVNAFDLHELMVLLRTGELEDAKTLLGLAWAGIPVFQA